MVLFKDIVLGQYMPVDSPVHKLDPRTKFLAVAAIMALTLVISNIWIYVLLFACLLSLVFLARLPMGFVFRNVRSFLWLFLITFAIHLLFTAGKPLPGIGVGTIEGFWRGLFFCFRVAILIVSAALLTLTTSPLELTDGLEKILSPMKWFGLSSHAVGPDAGARGANFNGHLIRRVKSLVPLLVPLFLSAFRRADELAVAMEARNYRTHGPRTHFRDLRFSTADYHSFVLLLLLGCGCLLAGRWLPNPSGG